MKRKNSKIGIVAISLATILFSQSVPMNILSAFAEEIADVFTQEETIEHEFYSGNMVDTNNIGNGYIIREIVENRTLTTKEYLMSDNTVMVQQFSDPVHYYEDGAYKEIDNSLMEDTEEDGESVYRNTANSFKVKFDKESKKNTDSVQIEENGYDLEIAYKAKKEKKVKTKVKNSKKKEKVDYKEKKLKKPAKNNPTTGEMTYENVEDNTKLTYKIKNNGLFESIVIGKSQASYTYTFELQSSNLTLLQNEDGSISANNKSGETKFVFSAPYMTDSEGRYSNAVSYTLNETDGKTELTITADSAWIDQQASFPVTIHPELKSVTKKNFKAANLLENGETAVESNYAYAGKKDGEKSQAFLNFKLPKVQPYYQLIGARVSFDYQQMSGASAYNVYVAETEKNLESITYEEKPQKRQELSPINATTQTATALTYESGNIDVNVISENTLTLGIESASEESAGEYLAVSTTASENTEVIAWYQRAIGLDDDYSMESFELEGATTYVNNGTGALTAVFDLASVNTLSDMPLEASLIYNDYYDSVLSGAGITSYMGKNFKLNFQQYIIQRDEVYELIDADGSISTFYLLSGTNYYSREKKLYYDSSSGIVSDLAGNQMHFTNGLLTKIVALDNPKESLEIVYSTPTSTQIWEVRYCEKSETSEQTTIKDSIRFNYSNGKLSTVATTAGGDTPYQVELEYEGDYLVGIYNTTGVSSETAIDQGVRTALLGYTEHYSSADLGGLLNYVYNNQKEGLLFGRYPLDETIYQVQKMSGANPTSGTRWFDYSNFTYYGIYTQIEVFENNVATDRKYVAFNNTKKVISEWKEAANGIISVVTTNNWNNASSQEADYTKETCSYYHNARDNTAYGLAQNAYTQKNIGVSDTEEENTIYRYAVVFRVSVSHQEQVLNTPLKLKVTIGDTISETISLEQSGKTYVSIPCARYNETLVKIQNLGTQEVTISDFKYTIVDSEQEEQKYDSTLKAHKLSATTTSLRSGTRTSTTYDDRQRVSSTVTRKIEDDSVVETTTYAYHTSGLGTGKLASAETKNQSGTVIERTDYTYTGSWNNCTETVTTTQGDLKMRSKTVKETTSNGVTITQTDENNIQTKAYYAPTNGDLRLVRYEYGNTYEKYAYNNLGQITTAQVFDKATNVLKYSQTDTYDANGVYLGSTYGGNTYAYGYNETGFVTSIGVNGLNTPFIQYAYNGNTNNFGANQLSYKTYVNGNVETYDYLQPTTGTGKRMQIEYRNSEDGETQGTYTYKYNDKLEMTSQSVQVGNDVAVTYDYGELDNLEQRKLTITGLHYHTEYTNYYNTLNQRVEYAQLYSVYACHTTNNYTISYKYNAEGQVSEMDYSTYNAEYGYDKLGRLTTRTVPYGYMDIQEERYVYKTYTVGDTTYTTNQLLRIEDGALYNGEARTATYDNNGYITSVGYNGETYTYEYDSLGRLAKENSTQYEYDNKNNLIKKTAGGVVTNYTYDSYNRLTSDGTNDYTYDLMGNPTTYKGNTFTWEQGRKLASGSMNGNNFTYNYDGNGMRYKKVVNGSTTEYYWNGSQLLYESRNGDRIYYIYGVTGIEGMIVESGYQDTVYYFDKNTLGDIVAIRDTSGNIIATYSYDAWGNQTVMDGYGYVNTSSSFIGNINPFRYRGYYYDNETGFYYLQTRYYDPTICRFINADNYELVSQLAGSHELNLYAYCGNNPVMYTDETGEGLLLAFFVGVLVGAAVGATTYTASEVISYAVTGEWSWSWWEFAGSVGGGALGGLLAPVLPGIAAAGIGGFSASAITMSLQNKYEGANYSLGYIFGVSLLSGGFSMIGYSVMKGIKIPGLNSGRGSFSAVSQQIITKLRRDIISKVSIKTLSKMYVANLYESGLDVLQGLYGG